MKDVKDYKEYESLYKDELVSLVREILDNIIDPPYVKTTGEYWTIEDSDVHCRLQRYFNRFGLNKKLTEKEFETRK